MTLEEALEVAARDLPEGYVIEINVENGSGWVDLYRSGENLHIDSTYSGLKADVLAAVNIAKEVEKLAQTKEKE